MAQTPSDDPLYPARQLLRGYSYLQLPDLSADRLAAHYVHSEDIRIPLPADRHSYLIASISRVLATYCAASDILIAVSGPARFIRVSWNDDSTWDDVAAAVDQGVRSLATGSITLESIRRVLELSDSQSPCVAFCHIGDASLPSQSSEEFPIEFYFNAVDSTLTLTSNNQLLHPSVSTQILSQVAALSEYVITNGYTPVSVTPSFPVQLMSVYQRVSDAEQLPEHYPLVPIMRLATDYLAQQAVSNPYNIAIRWYPDLSPDNDHFTFEDMTYSHLNNRANQTASWLLCQGLVTEDRVAVCMKRDLNYHTAMMGILRAGGCYVPIDPELPVERKTYIAKDAGARFVLTTTDVSPPELFGKSTLYLDDPSVQAGISKESEKDPDAAHPDGLAYLLYTSGTTGNPKGCLLTHRGLSQAILALSSAAADVRMEDLTKGRYLAVASIAFDVHIAETFVPISLGMPLFSAPRAQLLECLPLYVKLLEITHLGIVPSLIEATMNAVQDDSGADDLNLRYIASGGEKMSDSILDKWANHPQVRLANFYGPSEVTIGCCARRMSSSTPKTNIGRPFANVSGFVVDSDMNILLRGGIGELVVEGPLVGRGYHGRPDLTKKVFVEWPEKGLWGYRTGDLVRMMPDSTIEILGRIDTQIKLRGVRIESEGISAIVRKAAPSSGTFVLDATTVLAKHPAIGSDQLVTFFSWDGSISVATRKSVKSAVVAPPPGLLRKIRNICDAELASYMRPSHLVPVNWLPLSSNGKTDAKALVAMFNSIPVDTLAGFMAPEDGNISNAKKSVTNVETDVFNILKRHTTLPLETPYSELNLFECGLDSMGVIRFAADLKAKFGKRLSASDIMKLHTLAGVASLLASDGNTNNPESTYVKQFATQWKTEVQSSYDSLKFEELLPPFTVQEGVLARSVDQDTLYVQHVILHVKEGVSLLGLQKAWQEVAERHPILRTIFYLGRTLIQLVLPSRQCRIQWSEKGHDMLSDSAFSQWFFGGESSKISRDINASISHTPPVRLNCYISDITKYLVLSIHHALYDGISLPLLVHDVQRAYSGTELQPTAILSDVLNQISSQSLAHAQAFWKEQFSGFSWPSNNLQTRRRTSHTNVHFAVPFKATLSELKGKAVAQQVTLQALLTAAFAKLIGSHIYHSDDVVFGVIRSGRLLPVDNIEVAMCPMICIVPTRVNFMEPYVLRKIQEGISKMVEHEHIPLSKIQNWLTPGKPLFETLLSVSVVEKTSNELWELVESKPPEPDYPLSVEVVLDPQENSLLIQAAWLEGIFPVEMVTAFLESFEKVTLQLASDEQSKINPSPWIGTKPSGEDDDEGDENDAECDFIMNPDQANQLRTIVAEFLCVDGKSIAGNTSFISLGLDSIKSVGLARALRKYDIKVSSVELMKNASINKLGRYLEFQGSENLQSQEADRKRLFALALAEVRKALKVEDLTLAPEDTVELFPTTTLQAGMLTQTLNSAGELYVHAFPTKLSATVDIEQLYNSWLETVRSLSILRSSFHFIEESGVWAMATHSVDVLDWSVTSYSTDADCQDKIQSFVASMRISDAQQFSRPPIRIRLFKPEISDASVPSYLVLIMHHAIYDGFSIGRLFDTVKSFYRRQRVSGPYQYVNILDHFIYQEMLGTSFWIQKLRNFHPVSLLKRQPHEPAPVVHTVIRSVSFDRGQLENILHRGAVTLQCLGQAAWAKLIGSLTKSSDVVFGHVVSGRTIPGSETVIGPVLNTIPCRVQLRGGHSNIKLLQKVHLSNIEVMAWQQSSLRLIHKKLQVEKLWDSLFLFQPDSMFETEEEALWSLLTTGDNEVKIQYPLNIELHQRPEGFEIHCACRSDYFTATELRDLVLMYQKFLENMVYHPDEVPQHGVIESTNERVTDILPRAHNPNTSVYIPIPSVFGELLAVITKVPLAQISSGTPLAALGIDSITAIQLVARCRNIGIKLSASDVAASHTVGDIVARITEIRDKFAEKKLGIDISDQEREMILEKFGATANSIERVTPASPGMKWLIGAWKRSQRTRFQHAFAFKLSRTCDDAKLRNAWIKLTERHEILRSTFASTNDGREVRVITFAPGAQDSTWEEKNNGVISVVDEMKHLVSNPPPTTEIHTRARLLRIDEERYLVLHLHHFQYDAWSLQLLMHDLSCIYKGVAPCSSGDMSSFLEFCSPVPTHLKEQEEYWKKMFPSTYTPTLFPRLAGDIEVPIQQRTILTVNSALPRASVLEERARSLHVSLQAVFLACWAHVQAKLCSSTESTFGLWHSGRTGAIDDIARIAGPCINILPFFVSGISGDKLIDTAKDIQKALKERSSVVEQTELVNVNRWIGDYEGPLCNVFVNIVRIAPGINEEVEIMEPVEIPYYAPEVPAKEDISTVKELYVTELIQDDLLIDIAHVTKKDTILMSVDAAARTMNREQAKSIISQWAGLVVETLKTQ